MIKTLTKTAFCLSSLLALNTSAALITSEDFSSGASGWSNSNTSSIAGNQVLGGFNLFGAGASTQKTFNLSGNQTQVDINFDFWKGDSWDGESFFVWINGTQVYNRSFIYADGSQIAGQSHNLWNELLVPISLTYLTTASTLHLKFGSSLDQGPNDEWWALDNLSISDNAPVNVPEPSLLMLFCLGLCGLFGLRLKSSK